MLGLKREQIDGIRDEHVELVEKLQTDGGHVRRLAEAYLASRGELLEEQHREGLRNRQFPFLDRYETGRQIRKLGPEAQVIAFCT